MAIRRDIAPDNTITPTQHVGAGTATGCADPTGAIVGLAELVGNLHAKGSIAEFSRASPPGAASNFHKKGALRGTSILKILERGASVRDERAAANARAPVSQQAAAARPR